jgi:hypothetical protein
MPRTLQRITEITRREIVDRLLLESEPFYGRLGLIPFLQRVWPLSQMPSRDSRFKNAEGDIWQHMVNNDDWTTPELLYGRLDLTTVPDEQFGRFLETCLHPLTCPDRSRVESLAERFNSELRNDGFEMRKTNEISGRPVYKLTSMGANGIGIAYEIVLSFAGEDREYVEKVAAILRSNDVSLFYDDYEEVTLWGKNLTEHLHKVYSSSARFCVMFISAHYAAKMWPTHERRSAFEKAIASKEEYILPARFDDTEIPGLQKHIVYVDLRKKTPNELARMILEKLGRSFQEDDTFVEISDDDIPF